MRASLLVLLASALAVGVALAAPRGLVPEMSGADDGGFVRGVALGLFATDPDWDYGPLVEEIRARGATDVLLVVNAYQLDRFASEIASRPGHSPNEATVLRTLRQVEQSGMRAALMPVVRLQERAPHEWRAVIMPADGLDAWFASYERFVLPLARIAERGRAGRFMVGSELGSLERYEARWRGLISKLRTRFSGTLTYSANWDHADGVGFWDALDEIGITAYFPLSQGDEALSADLLGRAWESPRAEIDALGRRLGKPVLVTEVGYPSQRSAARHPWDDASESEIDLRLQQQLYRGFCDAFSRSSRISGFYVWNWFGFGGPRDTGFTPRGKPAATELAACFGRPWRAPADAGK